MKKVKNKRGFSKVIKEQMGKTFTHRRNEIVNQSLSIEDINARCPALFEASQVIYTCMLIPCMIIFLANSPYPL